MGEEEFLEHLWGVCFKGLVPNSICKTVQKACKALDFALECGNPFWSLISINLETSLHHVEDRGLEGPCEVVDFGSIAKATYGLKHFVCNTTVEAVIDLFIFWKGHAFLQHGGFDDGHVTQTLKWCRGEQASPWMRLRNLSGCNKWMTQRPLSQ